MVDEGPQVGPLEADIGWRFPRSAAELREGRMQQVAQIIMSFRAAHRQKALELQADPLALRRLLAEGLFTGLDQRLDRVEDALAGVDGLGELGSSYTTARGGGMSLGARRGERLEQQL